VPVWFKVVEGREEGSLRDVMTLLYGVNHELARILASNLGLGLKDALHVAEDAVARFAQEVEEAGRWRRFYYVDPETHKAYFSYLDEVRVADLQGGRAATYWVNPGNYGIGLALLVLEEGRGYIAELLSRRLGVEGAEERVERVVEELKRDPKNVVRAGFARLTTIPPASEEELREMVRYVEGSFQDRGLVEAWREVVDVDGRRLYLTDVFKVYLASRGTGYRLPERFRVYEHGDMVMLLGETGWGWEVAWYRVEGDRWAELHSAELTRSALQVLEDLMVEDFKKGRQPARIAKAAGAVAAVGFAERGYRQLARWVYRMVVDGKAYAKIVENSHGEDLAVHVVQNPLEGAVWSRFIFVVEHGGRRYLLDSRMAFWALHHLARGRLGLDDLDYSLLLDMYNEKYGLDELVGAVGRILRNPLVRAELPGDLERWLKRWRPLGWVSKGAGRQPASVEA